MTKKKATAPKAPAAENQLPGEVEEPREAPPEQPDDGGEVPADEPAGPPEEAPAPAVPEAAPLASPHEDKVHPGVRLQTSPHAIIAVMDERHIGIVDGAGRPVDVKTALVSNGPHSTAYRASRRIFEETTIPGTEQPRRRLLYGEGAIVPREEYEALCAAVAERAEQPA